MTSKKERREQRRQQSVPETPVVPQEPVAEATPAAAAPAAPVAATVAASVATGKSEKRVSRNGTTYYYNPESAKKYRDNLKAAAIRGGYQPKEHTPGSGKTEKRTSAKTGATYYYQPWSSLSDEQKRQRLDKARERAAQDRELAKKYREEHPEEFASAEKEPSAQ